MSEEIKIKNTPSNQKKANVLSYLKQMDGVVLMSIALITAFFATAVTLYFFPIYMDEILVRLPLSRFLYDFPFRSSGFSICVSTFRLSMPVTLYVPGLIEWLLHGTVDDFIVLRRIGLIIAFLWLAGAVIYLTGRLKDSLEQENLVWSRSRRYLYVTGFVLAMFFTGVFPFFLVLNRSEQLMLTSVMILIALSIMSEHAAFKSHSWKKLGGIGLYFTAVSMVLFAHAKGLFFTPLFLIVGWQVFRGYKTLWPRIMGGSLLGVQIGQSFFLTRQSLQCPESSVFTERIKHCGLDVSALFHHPFYFFEQAWGSLKDFPKYLNQLGFQELTDMFYLPTLPLGTVEKFANLFIKLDITVLFFALLFLVPLQYFRNDAAKGRWVTVNLALMALLVNMISCALFSLNKLWYEAGYAYAVLLIVMIFFIGENFPGIFRKTLARRILLYLGAVALLSQAVLVHRYLPPFLKGYNGLGAGISLVQSNARQEWEDIAAAARMCSIDPVNSQRVVVDDLTYFFFRKTRLPMHINYIGLGLGGQFKSLREFFSRVDSDGLVVRCILPLKSYAKVVRNNGNICCISKNDLKRM